jgi:hypothetical protein
MAASARGSRRDAYRCGMRFVFTAYLVLITAGLLFYIAIGIANHA